MHHHHMHPHHHQPMHPHYHQPMHPHHHHAYPHHHHHSHHAHDHHMHSPAHHDQQGLQAPYPSHSPGGHPSKQEMYRRCREHMHRYVLVQTNDGRTYDGFVENVDEDNLYLAVFINVSIDREEAGEQMGASPQGVDEQRQLWGYPGYGFYGFPGYGFYGPRPRRFRRLILPLAALTAISLLPYY